MTNTPHRITVRSLPVRLTDEELLKLGADIASTVQDISAEEDRQVDLKASMKARLSELEARRTQLAVKISRKEEYRDVRVRVEQDAQRGIVQEVREDTAEVITTRQMTDAERQASLDL